MWDILVDGVVPKALFVATEDGKAQPRKSSLSQKTACMCGQEKFIRTILARLKRLGDSQSELDGVYLDLLETMKRGLKEMMCSL